MHTSMRRRTPGFRLARWVMALAITVSGATLALVHSGPVAIAATGGDTNKGDVWVDNADQPSTNNPPHGHEMDPHLNCAPINLWGDKLADSSGTYTIDSWPPTGKGQGDMVLSHSWSYSGTGNKILDTSEGTGYSFTGGELVAAAMANGDGPAQKNQGWHFKLQFVQDPQKHKTFWVGPCSSPSSSTTSTPTPTPTPTPQSTTAANPTSSVQGVTTTAPTTQPTSGVQAAVTTTPTTGAEVPFGLGIFTVLSGASLMAAGMRRRDRSQ